MIDQAALDPLAFVASELTARGALVEGSEGAALALLPPPLAQLLGLPETCALAEAPAPGATSCGLGSALLDRLVAEVRADVPVASVTWLEEAPRLASAERLAERIVVRNGVADLLGVSHAAATYLAGVFAWTAEADDRYQGTTLAAVHAGTSGEPEAAVVAAIAAVIGGQDDRVTEGRDEGGALVALGGAAALAARSTLAIGARLDEVTAAVTRRRDRERSRIDEYFASLIAEASRPRRQVARGAIEARVAALRAEQEAKRRDLATRYTLRVRVEPVALLAVTMRVAELRVRLRRRKGERELALHVPPRARTPDALACVACVATTRSPLLCDDALHVLCERCAPDAGGRPRCPGCKPARGAARRS